jgi:hypothetical protein
MRQCAGVWNEHLVKKLTSPAVGFVQSKYDECIFFHRQAVYVLYTDDSILAGPDENELDLLIARIKSVGLDTTEEGEIEDFLGIHIDKIGENEYHLSQPQLIDQILTDLHLQQDSVTAKTTPAVHDRVLGSHSASPPFDGHFHSKCYW